MFKKLLVFILIPFLLIGCESNRTMPDGTSASCVGLNNKKDPRYNYEFSVRNIILGIIFIEIIAPPVIVIFKELQCPTGYANLQEAPK